MNEGIHLDLDTWIVPVIRLILVIKAFHPGPRELLTANC